MPDIIKLLPDSVANQIAAGEVVQRPASAVKELLENSLDAGATEIRLIIKDGGSTLMQVIDNGAGMTDTDARMCWERHATSKIESAPDIYALQTFGFRGEALASIAAVSQVELKTRRQDADAATFIRIEGSKITEQSLVSGPVGTSIAVKNLFYNIPARRNFLKSAAVESRHIMEEFQRQALAWPGVEFKFYNNESETFHLKPGTLEDRIREVLGIKKALLEVGEQTEILGIEGYVGAPETARKTRGDQYFYVNGRFIRSAYFNHAVQAAFEGTIESNAYPTFVLNLSIDPARIDVNVHPTKTEVKFEDERHIYNIIKAAVRKAIGGHIMQPDAELFGLGGIEDFLNQGLPIVNPATQSSQDFRSTGHGGSGGDGKVPNYNPFTPDYKPRQTHQDWARILGPVDDLAEIGDITRRTSLLPDKEEVRIQDIFTLQNRFAVCKIQDELFFIDLKVAKEKTLYHTFLSRLTEHKAVSQQLLFPRTLDLNPGKLQMFLELQEEFGHLGFDVSHFGGNSILINGLPPEVSETDEAAVIEGILEDITTSQSSATEVKHDNMALSMAKQAVRRYLSFSDASQARILVESLFSIENATLPHKNKPVAMKIGTEFIVDLFNRK